MKRDFEWSWCPRDSLLGANPGLSQACGSSAGRSGLGPWCSCPAVLYLSACWSCAQLSFMSRCFEVTRAARLGCKFRSWDTVTSSIWRNKSSWEVMETRFMRDEPPWPRGGLVITTSPLGAEEAVSAYPKSLAAPRGDSPIHPTASATHTELVVAELTWEGSVRMLPRAQRTRQSVALTITWLAMSLTSRSWHGSPSPGFPVLQMLLCCKKRPRSAVG